MTKVVHVALLLGLVAGLFVGLGQGVANGQVETPIPPGHKILVPAGLIFPPIEGLTLLYDYGSYAVYRIADSALAGLDPDLVAQLQLVDEWDVIALDGLSFNTQAGLPEVPEGLRQDEPAGSALQLIQFVGPLDAKWLEDLAAGGIVPIQEIPNNAYLVWTDATGRLLLESKDFVQFSTAYHPWFKFGAGLQKEALEAGEGSVAVALSLYSHEGMEQSLKRVENAALQILEPWSAVAPLYKMTVRLRGADLRAIALLPEVVRIEYVGEKPVEPDASAPEATWPGPDGYGYSGQATTYSWVDISATGTAITGLGDDSYAGPFNIGFTFPFYGTGRTQFYVGSNGYLTFGSGTADRWSQCPLPNVSVPNDIIALMWDDLYPNYSTGGAYYQSFASCPVIGGRCLIMEYKNWNHYSGGVAGTFEAILFENGNIMMQFQDSGAETGLNSTTGIEGNNQPANYGLTYACHASGSIPDNLAIIYSLVPDFGVVATPTSQTLCAPNDAVYNVTVSQLNNFTASVSLSASGYPAGTTAAFVPNPVTPPGTSVLTIGNTGAAAAGTYSIGITGVGGGITHTTSVQLTLFTMIPPAPVLVSPADGATGVVLKPTLTWNAATQATSYYLEVATDPAFATVVYNATTTGTSHTLTSMLVQNTTYYWRVRGDNICGQSAYSTVWGFTTRIVPSTLLVDDDDNGPNVVSYYTAALDALGVSYDIWDTGVSEANEPDAATLALYRYIIWFSGDAGSATAGPSAATETNLGNWLTAGSKCLFVSSEEYFAKGVTAFKRNYLGLSSGTEDGGDFTSVTGEGLAFSGLGPYALSYPVTDWSDVLVPDSTAEVSFRGNNTNRGAIDKMGANYRTTFWGFPLEAISTAANRQAALQRVLGWCGMFASDYVLTVVPASQNVCAGSDSVYTTTLVQLGGFNSPVDLSASGQPSGATVTFNPNPATPPTRSVMTIGNTGGAAAGAYTINITGVGNGITHNASTLLTVYAGAPAAPVLTSPADGALYVPVQPVLRWDAVPDALSYFVQVASDPAFTTVVYSASSTTNSHTVASALAYNTTYYWHVAARNPCGQGSYSTTFSFTTVPSAPMDRTISPDNLFLDVFFNCDTATDNGGFQVLRTGSGQAFSPGDRPADYGIFTRYGSCVVGPTVLYNPSDDSWDTCLYSSLTGAGTSLDPWLGKARFTSDACGTASLVMTYTLSYINGYDYYDTSWRVCGGAPGASAISYFAADIYMYGSDYGYGYYHPSSGSVGGWRSALPDQWMYFTPLNPAPATHYMEDSYGTIWTYIGNGVNFADTISSANIDNGAGLQWNQTFDANGCIAISARTSFSPIGIYVDDDYNASTPGWQVTRFDKIQDGINAAPAGETVYVENVTMGPLEAYTESVTLNKNITVHVNGSMQLNGPLTIQQGKWIATLGTMGITGNFAHTGGIFDPRTGTTLFNGTDVSTYSGIATSFYNLTVSAGKILDVGTNALFGVSNVVTNNGGLRQTLTAPGGVSTVFLNISTTKYHGVTLLPAGNMGATTVTVYGNQLCPNITTAVRRCYEITPQQPQTATITFFYRDAEENGQTTADAFHWDGALWQLQPFVARNTSGVENNWVQASGISAYSPFALYIAPTAVQLVSFEAAPAVGGALVSWETASEVDNVGFNLYRSNSLDSPGERLNAQLIPSRAPGGGEGARYEFLDTTALPGAGYYTLEDIDASGARTRHGPIELAVWRVYLPVVIK